MSVLRKPTVPDTTHHILTLLKLSALLILSERPGTAWSGGSLHREPRKEATVEGLVTT